MGYKTKDNSKLRSLLSHRHLSTSGIREEMISRLEDTPFDYNTLTSERIVELLKERHLANTAVGSKAVKIQRLMLNDSLDRDTGNYEDMKMYLRTDVMKTTLDDLVAKQAAMLPGDDQTYSTSTWTLGRLRRTLQERELPFSCAKEAMRARLRANDFDKLFQDVSDA